MLPGIQQERVVQVPLQGRQWLRQVVALIACTPLLVIIQISTTLMVPATSFAQPGSANRVYVPLVRTARAPLAISLGTTVRVSLSSGGTQGDEASYEPTISATGRFVAFASGATNLVAGDTNGASDVFLHDQLTGQTRRVSVASGGAQGDADSLNPSIAANGRFIAFESYATTLVSDDWNGAFDVFVHDRQTGETTLVSRSSLGVQGNSVSHSPAISGDGRYVAFLSHASNLVTGDANGVTDLFLHDRQQSQTARLAPAVGQPAISEDGRYVAFASEDAGLVAGDNNGVADLFVYDRVLGQITLASRSSYGAQGRYPAAAPAISADGRFVAFEYAPPPGTPADLATCEVSHRSYIMLHDRERGTTHCITGVGQGETWHTLLAPALSGDGRYVAFRAEQRGTQPHADIVVYDSITRAVEQITVPTFSSRLNGWVWDFALAADGSELAFASSASNLVTGDSNRTYDIFTHERISTAP